MKAYGVSNPLDELSPSANSKESGRKGPAATEKLSHRAREALNLVVLPALNPNAAGKTPDGSTNLAQRTWDRPSTVPKALVLAKPEKEKTKADRSKEWGSIRERNLTDDQKAELRVLALRNAVDGKVGAIDWNPDNLPRNVQFGTVIENAVDWYSSRLTKKQRASNMVDELVTKDEKALSKLKRAYGRLAKSEKSFRKDRKKAPRKLPERRNFETTYK